MAHITVDELHKELTDVDRHNGFANRFLWMPVRRQSELPNPQPFDDHVMAPYVAELNRRLVDARKSRVIRTPAADEVYRASPS